MRITVNSFPEQCTFAVFRSQCYCYFDNINTSIHKEHRNFESIIYGTFSRKKKDLSSSAFKF